MLSIQAIESGLPLAEKLYANGVNLGAVMGSPLQKLVGASGVSGNFVSSVNGKLVYDANYAAQIANTSDTMTGYSEHDEVMKESTAVAIPGLMAQIAYARNEGAAIVEELASRVQAVAEQINYTTLSGAGVRVRKDNPLLSEPTFTESVMQSRELPLFDDVLEMDLPSLQGHEIRAMLKTGVATVDQCISAAFEDKSDEQLISLWNSVYSPNRTKGVSLTTYIGGINNVDNAIFVYLTALKLSTKIFEGANMSEARYMSAITSFRNSAARRICVAIEALASDVEMGRLVYEVRDRIVYVNGVLYKRWLDSGGSVDAILGASTTGNLADMTLQKLEENRDKFEAVWKDQYLLSQKTYANKHFNRVKEILTSEFAHQCGEASADDFPLADRQIALHLFAKEVERIRPEDVEDMTMLCLRLLGASRFRNRSVCEILSGVALVRKQNPDATAAEAANVAIIEYVTRWVASMITVERSQMLTTG